MPLQAILTKYLRLRYPETLALLHRIEFYARGGYSIFGICLGAQLLAKAFGAKIVRHRTSLDLTKFAIGEQVDNAADNREGGTIIAVFPTVEGSFRYAVDTEGYGALKFFNEEKLVRHLH
jgi:hypothetical protein